MATKSKNSLGSMLGVLVIAALIFVLMNMFGMAQLGKFGCGYMPTFNIGAPAAHAESGCPESLKGAMSDPEWAADRHAAIKDETRTVGLFYDEDGIEHRFRSGDEKGTDAQRVQATLREIGVPTNRAGEYPAASHVELKVAALMRETGVKVGVLVINREQEPCIGRAGQSCQELLPRLLPSNAHLRVWYRVGETMRYKDFP